MTGSLRNSTLSKMYYSSNKDNIGTNYSLLLEILTKIRGLSKRLALI